MNKPFKMIKPISIALLHGTLLLPAIDQMIYHRGVVRGQSMGRVRELGVDLGFQGQMTVIRAEGS